MSRKPNPTEEEAKKPKRRRMPLGILRSNVTFCWSAYRSSPNISQFLARCVDNLFGVLLEIKYSECVVN
jgi:hypothetical protein